MGHLENGTVSMTFFIILLVAFGFSLPGVGIQNTINNLFKPWPTIGNSSLNQCQLSDLSCNTANVVLATEHIAVSIEYPAILFFNLLGRISAFFGAIVTIILGPEAGVISVPFLDLVFIGIIVIPASFEVFRMARGNASGGTL